MCVRNIPDRRRPKGASPRIFEPAGDHHWRGRCKSDLGRVARGIASPDHPEGANREQVSMKCTRCGDLLFSRLERQRGTCAPCHLAAGSPEKGEAIEGLLVPLGRRVEPRQTDIEPDGDGQSADAGLGRS
jgi:hypothetical protein